MHAEGGRDSGDVMGGSGRGVGRAESVGASLLDDGVELADSVINVCFCSTQASASGEVGGLCV